MSPNEPEYHSLLKNDLGMFIERSFRYLNPKTEYLTSWHLDVMAYTLERVRLGECKRLIINVPPRSLKSHGGSIALPAYLLGHNPSAQIICVSYGQDLADKLSMDCRNVMQSDWYKELFRTRLSPHMQSRAEFATTANGFRKATSVGGVLTGRGADFIILDDPLKPDEAISDTQRTFTNDWYDATLFSRLNDKTEGAIIIIMQRLHVDDLVGHVLEKGAWEVLSFPAIAQEDEAYEIRRPYGTVQKCRRKAGEALHPERESLETLEQIRRTIGEYNYAGQYLQSPVPPGGGMIKRAWFKSYVPGEEPAHFDMIVHSWDTANKETQLSDYSVCTVWGLKESLIYLLQVVRRRLNYPDLKRAVMEMADRYPPDAVLIEDKASGTQLIEDLKQDGLWSVKACQPEGDKVMRLHAQSLAIENGFVYLPTEAPWLDDYLHELTSFPKSKYDDQVDSTSQALAWMRNDRGPDYDRLNAGMQRFLGSYVRGNPFYSGWGYNYVKL